jgi:hypothetical protein
MERKLRRGEDRCEFVAMVYWRGRTLGYSPKK